MGSQQSDVPNGFKLEMLRGSDQGFGFGCGHARDRAHSSEPFFACRNCAAELIVVKRKPKIIYLKLETYTQPIYFYALMIRHILTRCVLAFGGTIKDQKDFDFFENELGQYNTPRRTNFTRLTGLQP